MGHAIIRGNTVEEKFESANKALMQLERRISARSIVAPLTPIIVMGYCKEDEDGVIVRGMFPISGTVAKVSAFIGRLEDPEFLKKNSLIFRVETRQPDGTVISKEIQTRELVVGAQSNFKVAADSRIIVSVNVKVFDVYYGLVLEPETPIKRKVDVSDIEVLAPVELEMIEE
jgi:hypothetical protein